jgi:hypothetical protein
MQTRTSILPAVLLACLASASAMATAVPAGISVSGTLSLDIANSSPAVNGSQSGAIRFTGLSAQTGTHTTVNEPFSDVTIANNNLSGQLTQTSDGVFFDVALSGAHGTPGAASSDGLFIDLFLSFANTGSTAYKAFFKADTRYGNLQASGPDAFLQLDFSLQDSGNNELFYSRYWRDTLNGDVSDQSSNSILEVLLNPGDTVSFHALQSARAGAFAAQSSYSGSVSGGLELLRFTPLSTPLPLPSSLLLFSIGMGMLGWCRRSV